MYAQSVLIADPDKSSWHDLPRALSSWLPEKQFGFCTRRDEALDQVANPASLFDLVISSVGFAELDNFFLLNGLKCLSVPLVITTGASTLAASRRALGMGAFGIIPLPVDGKLAAKTLTLATGLTDIHRRTAVYHDLLKTYHERLDACPRDPELEEVLRTCEVVLESTYDMWRDTISHMEQSVRRLAYAAVNLEDEARFQAYAQLRELEFTKAMSQSRTV
jgi:DNA-binding NtrC family response regulator